MIAIALAKYEMALNGVKLLSHIREHAVESIHDLSWIRWLRVVLSGHWAARSS
jgi:hypothetical protein